MVRDRTLSGRGRRLVAALLVIAAGLAIRTFGNSLGLSFFVAKYGGSVLWGAMVFLLLGAVTGSRSTRNLVVLGLLIAAGVEVFRLYHTPVMDAFRLTTAGKLLIGRVFSVWNILAYAIGIGLAAALDARASIPVRECEP